MSRVYTIPGYTVAQYALGDGTYGKVRLCRSTTAKASQQEHSRRETTIAQSAPPSALKPEDCRLAVKLFDDQEWVGGYIAEVGYMQRLTGCSCVIAAADWCLASVSENKGKGSGTNTNTNTNNKSPVKSPTKSSTSGCEKREKVGAIVMTRFKSTLWDVIRSAPDGRPISQRDQLKYAICMARGLCEMHSRGVAHVDFKPENVLIQQSARERDMPTQPQNPLANRLVQSANNGGHGGDGSGSTFDTQDTRFCAICDFTNSHYFGGQAWIGPTRPGQFTSLNECAPEIALGLSFQFLPKADVWSLGVVLLHMILGEECFEDLVAETSEKARRLWKLFAHGYTSVVAPGQVENSRRAKFLGVREDDGRGRWIGGRMRLLAAIHHDLELLQQSQEEKDDNNDSENEEDEEDFDVWRALVAPDKFPSFTEEFRALPVVLQAAFINQRNLSAIFLANAFRDAADRAIAGVKKTATGKTPAERLCRALDGCLQLHVGKRLAMEDVYAILASEPYIPAPVFDPPCDDPTQSLSKLVQPILHPSSSPIDRQLATRIGLFLREVRTLVFSEAATYAPTCCPTGALIFVLYHVRPLLLQIQTRIAETQYKSHEGQLRRLVALLCALLEFGLFFFQLVPSVDQFVNLKSLGVTPRDMESAHHMLAESPVVWLHPNLNVYAEMWTQAHVKRWLVDAPETVFSEPFHSFTDAPKLGPNVAQSVFYVVQE